MKLKYAFKGISTHVIYSFLLIAQLAFSFSILYDNINLNKMVSEDSNHVSKFFENKIYGLREMGLNEWNTEKMTSENINYVVSYLQDSKKFQYIENSCNAFYAEGFGTENDFKMSSGETQIDNKSFNMLKNYTLNETFLKKYKLQLKSGRYFSDAEMKFGYGDNNVLPVIVGGNYGNHYKIGDEFSYLREGKYIKKAKVIGILENDDYIIGAVESTDSRYINTNNYMITTDALFSDSISRLMMCFNGNYLLFDKNTSEEDIEKKTNEIKYVFKDKLNLATTIKNHNKYAKTENTLHGQQRKSTFSLSIVLIAFASITLIISILDTLMKRKLELGLHVLSGGTLTDISQIIYLEIFITLLISLLFSLFFVYNSHHGFNYTFLLIEFGLIIIFSFIISIIPILKILNLNVVELIKGEE